MKTILLIEDNPEILENTAEILELAGYTILAAGDGKKGIELAISHQPDLVLCDIMMPLLDGFEVLLMLQHEERLRNIPFIFLTAKTEHSDIRRGMKMGADDYITKPFEPTDLLQAVEIRLKKAEIGKQVFSSDLQGLSSLMYQAIGKDVLQHLSDSGNPNKYNKKHPVYLEGNHPRCLFYLQKGKMRTFRCNEEGKELVTGLYSAGDFMGYTALLENCAYKDTAEALEDCEVAEISREDFEELLYNNNDAAIQLIRLLARNVREKEQQLLGIAYNSLRKKVADALISLHQKFNVQGASPFVIEIGRDNLAAIAGTARESLIRTLAAFRQEGLIDIREGAIIILNEKKMENMLY